MSSGLFKTLRSCTLTLALLVSASYLYAEEAKEAVKFKEGDHVCFIGDSITHGGGFNYHSQVILFYATRFPQMHFDSWNCGVSGDSAGGALKRYDWDIAVNKPTVASIMLGMNDVWRDNYGKEKTAPEFEAKHKQALDSYIANMAQLSEKLSKDGVKLIFITPSIYDQTGNQKAANLYGVNDALKICGDEGRKLAAKYNSGVVDFHTLLTKINAEVQEKDPNSTIIGADRVHPGGAGHLIMAYAFLKAQGFGPTVSTIGINANGKGENTAVNCDISSLSVKPDSVSFDALEKSLPFPIDDGAKQALELVPIINDLDQETLQIGGLEEGDYEILIDGQTVLKSKASELEKGVNLAIVKETPQYKQAQKVLGLLKTRTDIYSSKLRTLVAVRHFTLSKLKDHSPEAEQKAIDEQLEKNKQSGFIYGVKQLENYVKYLPEEENLKKQADELLQKAYVENQPKIHHYEVRKLR